MIPLLSIKQFFRDMRNQKLRTLMTMFGILWGTSAIVLLMGFGTGLQEHNKKEMKGMGENISIIWSGMTSKPWKGLPRGRRIRYTEEDIARMKANLSSIERISPEFTRWSVTIKNKRNTKLTRVSGVWPEFCEMRSIIPQMGGRFLNAFDMAEKRRVLFIGNQLAENLFGSDDPVGKMVFVNNVPFTVVGVMKPKQQNSSYGGRDSRQAWIPSATFKTMWSHRYPNNTVVQSPDPHTMERVKDDIFGYMAGRYNFDPEDTEALSIWDTTEGLKFLTTFFMAFKFFLVGIGCLTLITGGIGVTNIMNVVLEERTKEIGIKMAVGAKKATIMGQFLLETIFLTGLGGALGFLIAAAIITIFPTGSFEEHIGTPTIDLGGAVFTTVLLGIVALVSGYFPAKRAANLEPVKALKLF
jgi:putative ABC transport system permease protein